MTKPSLALGLLLATLPFTGNAAETKADKDRPIIGRIEYVALPEADVVLKGRIDTGAGLASINAKVLDIKKDKDGKKETVVFVLKDDKGHQKQLERPVVEWVNIKVKGGSEYAKRPVIKLDFCLAGTRVEARANLADRSNYLYPVLIGRNVLKAGDFLIDPEKKFTQDPKCKS